MLSSVLRYSPLSLRSGSHEDWKTVRWSLLDDGSGQGTFVNQSRLESGAPVSLNADDLIGLGSGDPASSRAGGRETFVYRLRPPEAFLDLVNITRLTPPVFSSVSVQENSGGLDMVDSEASTPPPLDLSDLELSGPEPEPSPTQPTSAQPSTSTSGGARADSSSPELCTSWAGKPTPRIKLKRNRASKGEKETEPKKLKHLFGSEEEEDHPVEKASSELKASEASQFSPISSDDETFPVTEECQVQAMDLSTSPKEPARVEESQPVNQTHDVIIKELAEKIKRAKALSQASVVPPPLIPRFPEPLLNIKTEPGLVRVEVPAMKTGGYSEEPECITILDSDEDSCENDFVAELVGSLEYPPSDDLDLTSVGGEDRPEDTAEDSDDEIQIISASETPLFAAITKKIKVEYDCEEQEAEVDIGVNHEETIDEACATIERDLEEIKQDELIREVMAEAGCSRVNVVEAIEAAKLEYSSSSPTVEQVLHVLLGEVTEPETDSEHEEPAGLSQPRPQKVSLLSRHSSDSIDDLLADSEDEDSFRESVERRVKSQSVAKSSSQVKSSDQNQPSTSSGSSKKKSTVFWVWWL